MGLPYTFISGDLARSAQVNANFQYLSDLIGQDSTPGTISPSGAFVLGPRKTGMLTAEHDTGSAAKLFAELSWNAHYTKTGSEFKYKRVLTNLGGSAIRVGSTGFQFLTTIKKSGDIHTQMRLSFQVGEDATGLFMYAPSDLALSTVAESPSKRSERRLTTVILDSPRAIYQNKAVAKGTASFNAYNYGVPREATAIIVRTHVTASWASGAGMLLYPRGGSEFHGHVAHATITGTGMGMRTGSQGVVPLGTGSYAGHFVIERTERFELANVHIIGYLV